MKPIQDYINELVNESSQDSILKKLQSSWDRANSKHAIDMGEMVDFCKKALKSAKTTPHIIMSEISEYKDPDDLLDAMDRGELKDVNVFLDEFAHVLSLTDKYEGQEGDYADGIADPWFLYELMDYIGRFEK